MFISLEGYSSVEQTRIINGNIWTNNMIIQWYWEERCLTRYKNLGNCYISHCLIQIEKAPGLNDLLITDNYNTTKALYVVPIISLVYLRHKLYLLLLSLENFYLIGPHPLCSCQITNMTPKFRCEMGHALRFVLLITDCWYCW